MDWSTLLAAALTLVVRFVVIWFFNLIGWALDEMALNSLVAAIVAYLIGLFGVQVVRGIAPKTRSFLGG